MLKKYLLLVTLQFGSLSIHPFEPKSDVLISTKKRIPVSCDMRAWLFGGPARAGLYKSGYTTPIGVFTLFVSLSFVLSSWTRQKKHFIVFYVLFVNTGNEGQVVTLNNAGFSVIWDSHIESFRFTPSLHHGHSTLSYKLPRLTFFSRHVNLTR